MSLPLTLTLLRIVFSPVFLVIYLYHTTLGIHATILPYMLIALLAFCEISDFLDGFIARRKNIVTDLGKILDPMADSIFRLTVFFTFTQGIVQIPLILVLVFFFRDSIISMLRTICAMNGVTLAARLSGKIKAVVQAVTAFFILILMVPYTLGCLSLTDFQAMSFYVTLIAAIYTVISGIEYIFANRTYVKRAIKKL